MTDLAFLGTDVMGLPMARNLNQEGFAVHAWNRTAERGALDLPYARLKGPSMVKRDFGDVSFALSLARKDSQLVLAAADEAGIELPIMRGALARLQTAEADGHGDEDMGATYWSSAPDN